MIPQDSSSIIIPHDIILEASLKVCKRDKSALGDNVEVSFVNNILPSLFSKFELQLGKKNTEGGQHFFGLKNYIHQLLNFTPEAKETWMKTSGWADDKPGTFNCFAREEGKKFYANKGYIERKRLFRNADDTQWLKDPTTLLVPLHCDLASTKTGLLNKLGLNIMLKRQEAKFYLLSNDPEVDAMIDIVALKIHIKAVTIEPKIYLQVTERLKREPALYHYRSTLVYVYPIAVASPKKNIEQVFQLNTPYKALFFLSESDSIQGGDVTKNPYSFRHEWPGRRCQTIIKTCPKHMLTTVQYDQLVEELAERVARFNEELTAFQIRQETSDNALKQRLQQLRELEHRELPRDMRRTSPSLTSRRSRLVFL